MNKYSPRGGRLYGAPYRNSKTAIPNSGVPITRGGIVTGTGTSLSVPSGLQLGDVLLVVSVNTNATCLLATGFTNGQAANTNAVGYRWAYKVVTGSVDTTVAGLTSAANHWITYFRGVSTSPVLDVAAPTRGTATSGSPNSPSITPVTSNALVLSIAYRTVSDSTCTAPTGFSDTQFTAFASRTINFASKTVNPVAATDPSAWTVGITTGAWIAVTIALRPITSLNTAGLWSLGRPLTEWYASSRAALFDLKRPESKGLTEAAIFDLTTKGRNGVLTGGYTRNLNNITLNGTSGLIDIAVTKANLGNDFYINIWEHISNSTGSLFSMADTTASASPWILISVVVGTGITVYVKGGYNLNAPVTFGAINQIGLAYNISNTKWTLYVNGLVASSYTGSSGSNSGLKTLIGNGYAGYHPVKLYKLDMYSAILSDEDVFNLYLKDYRSYQPRITGNEYTDTSVLSAHFHMDDDNSYPGVGTYWASLYGYSMYLSHEAIADNDGSFVGFANMNGTSHYIHGGPAKGDLGSTFTIAISFLLKAADTRTFFTISNGPLAVNPFMQLHYATGNLLGHVNGGFNLSTPISINEWHVVHLTYDSTTFRMYVDGILKSSYTGSIGSNDGYESIFGYRDAYGYCACAIQQYKFRANLVLNPYEIYKEGLVMLAARPNYTGP